MTEPTLVEPTLIALLGFSNSCNYDNTLSRKFFNTLSLCVYYDLYGLEVLNPEKRALSAGERSRWPDFTFFNFPGTVLPFFNFGSTKPGKTSA
jgi:hypothetical protein